ncbi:putative sugar uptake protein [Salmonella enterica subsp. enterica serovar Choleraesuis]|nr:putative sugar uptake protein [Salmonella enterica subsp. enterica serovar Choleraesuis]
MNIIIALLPALFWGLLPVIVTRAGGNPVQQIVGTTLGTLLISIIFYLFSQPHFTPGAFIFSFISGAFWAFGQINQYKAFTQIGVSRAMPISTGLQLTSTSLMGVALFGEWPATSTRLLGLAAIVIIIIGIALTTRQQNGNGGAVNMKKGLVTLLISTIGYLGFSAFPRFYNVDGWEAFMPQAIGMFSASLLMAGFLHQKPAFARATWRNLLSGVVFAFAAFSYLISAKLNGVATGFTLSQMNVVIATLASIWLLGERKTRQEMGYVVTGLLFVVSGGVIIGLL